MAHGNARDLTSQYAHTRAQGEVEFASPHRLVQLLMNGALDRVATAKGCMARRQFELKGMQINWAISLINGLRTSLDMEHGGPLAEHLEDLYQYMVRRLAEAHGDNDVGKLDEVSRLLREIKSAWDAIPDEVTRMSRAELEAQVDAMPSRPATAAASSQAAGRS